MSDIPKICKYCGEPSFNGSEDKRLFGCGTIYWFASAAWVSGQRCHHNLVLDRNALHFEVKQLTNERDEWKKAAFEVTQQANETRDNLTKERDEACAEVKKFQDDYNRLLKLSRHEIEVAVKQRDEARAEVERLKDHLPDATKMIRPEPSRLEIAAMALMGMRVMSPKHALKEADELIEAAKGGAK
jgi:multidrug resistance efflux pump